MSSGASYRQILRSSSIIGGASVINILIGLLRTKMAALLLGPTGMGLIGLFQSLMATASTLSSLGFGTVGTRQIAEATGRNDPKALATVRQALFLGTFVLALVGSAVFWVSRGVLAEWVLSDREQANELGWLGLGLALTVISGAQTAYLNGLRRIGDLARVNILSAILSTLVGIGILNFWGSRGILGFVLAAPLANSLLATYFVSKLPKKECPVSGLRQLAGEWRRLTQLGIAFMVAGLATSFGHLIVRTMVQRELGTEALGHFQAAWAISMTYIGFVLQAMGTDYYPRLTTVINEPTTANRLVNEQTEVALLLASPLFLAMLGLAPWVIELLYSNQFADSVSVLRWQVLGDLLKVASWPLGFVILASGDGRTFVITETLSVLVFVGLTWLGMPLLGIEATGIAFFCMYLVLLPVVYWLAWRRTGFSWNASVVRHLGMLLTASVGVCMIAEWSVFVGAGAGIMFAAIFGAISLSRLGALAAPNSRVGRAAMLCRTVLVKARILHD